ncbi:hypothetical protein F5Y16DRAFT_417250 [Xylariaceae sp. FL0255]|nr:hypothetical protein F5Y16DRAFT_417250 [Xylariaceae sp. FL0255]
MFLIIRTWTASSLCNDVKPYQQIIFFSFPLSTFTRTRGSSFDLVVVTHSMRDEEFGLSPAFDFQSSIPLDAAQLSNRRGNVELVNEQKPYAIYCHHLARACWLKSPIILRQCSPEAEDIFQFILELYNACGGQWVKILEIGTTLEELDRWLDSAGMFLSGLGNYFGNGHHKVTPDLSADTLRKMARVSSEGTNKLERITAPLLTTQPSRFGYSTDRGQSNYYFGDANIIKEEIEAISNMMIPWESLQRIPAS